MPSLAAFYTVKLVGCGVPRWIQVVLQGGRRIGRIVPATTHRTRLRKIFNGACQQQKPADGRDKPGVSGVRADAPEVPRRKCGDRSRRASERHGQNSK